ncbi:unnamed protein product [Brassica rapa]|uniref:Small ribosomal subunit protein uS15 N-terminal domain-containing protein n=1 Tax=Brassica campestris TaxID=3711 RepID=A0A3P5ZC51_BRACM|nr:unnamed protein product [Brassica rapa]VDC69788.1 unnamed protein product [Brassica rapa]
MNQIFLLLLQDCQLLLQLITQASLLVLSKPLKPYLLLLLSLLRELFQTCKLLRLDLINSILLKQVDESICKFAKKGLTPSQIGVILRDSHGIPQVKSVTGNKILRILKAHGLAPEIPEDLYHLIKKAVAIRKHLERNGKYKDSKFRLILVESRIHRLARYYKKTKKLPPVWKYEFTTASTLVA